MTQFVITDGPNFSGRSDWLRARVGLPPTASLGIGPISAGGGAFVGPEVTASFLGVASTVAGELSAQSALRSEAPRYASKIVRQLEMLGLLERDPFTLSGGEQALVAICAAFASDARSVSLDVATEQLSPTMTELVAQDAGTYARLVAPVAVCDNRAEAPFERVATERKLFHTEQGSRPRLQPTALEVRPFQNARPFQFQRIGFAYRPSQPVLRELTVQLEPGQTYHLKGPNGSGKSTFAKLFAGLLKPQRGEFIVGRRRVFPHRKPASIAAYHFQNPDLQLFRTTVRDELAAACGARADWQRSVAGAFGVDAFLDSHPLDLPWVLRKRVALACTVAMDRQWLVLDEPTLGQDAATIDSLGEIIKRLNYEGRGIVIISHAEGLAKRLAPTVLQLRNGTVGTS